jgi:hypothetical protein
MYDGEMHVYFHENLGHGGDIDKTINNYQLSIFFSLQQTTPNHRQTHNEPNQNTDKSRIVGGE